jgi:hypothetical protein
MTVKETLTDIRFQAGVFEAWYPEYSKYHLAGYILGVYHSGMISGDDMKMLVKEFGIEVYPQ